MKKNKIEKNQTHSDVAKIMTANVPVVDVGLTVGEVESKLIRRSADYESINYAYIVNTKRKLLGVLSIKEIFRQEKSTKLKDFTKRKLISVRASTDQERAAYLSLRHNIKAIPVTDKNGIFLGAVLSDNILQTLYNESQEDMYKIAGVHSSGLIHLDDISKASTLKLYKNRFPWLLFGLLGGLFIAKVIGHYEEVLSENIIIASYIPLVVYVASATGTQMGAFIIRDLAMNPSFNFYKYFLKQVSVVALLAISLSGTFLVINLFLFKNFQLGSALSLAMFISILSSLFTGLLVPYFLNKLKYDPASASGPLATIMQDSLSVIIYFFVVSILL